LGTVLVIESFEELQILEYPEMCNRINNRLRNRLPMVVVIDWSFFFGKTIIIVIDYDKLFEKTIGRQNDYNEKDLLLSKINHRIKIKNVLSLVN
jgi:hypothetical protein